MSPTSWRLILHSVAVLAFVPEAAVAAELRVPSQYATINAALDAATEGDQVLVAPGVYSDFETRQIMTGGHVSAVGFLKKGVALLSEGGAEVTVLRMDATVAKPVILFYLGTPGDASIQGFTFTGSVPDMIGIDFSFSGTCVIRDSVFRDFGTGLPSELGAGGVSSDLEFYNCRFENINASGGAGIYGVSITAIVEDCEFVDLSTSAIYCYHDWPHATGLTVRRCKFRDSAQTGEMRSGIAAIDFSNVVVEECEFVGMSCTGNGCGIATGGFGTVVEIRGCTFLHNQEVGAGLAGGIASVGSNITVEGNTFFDNSQQFDWPTGGASAVFWGGAVSFRRNIVVSSGGSKAVGLMQGTIATSCNVFWDNPLGNSSGFSLAPSDLVIDPLFCDPDADDFTLNVYSPCLPGNHPYCTELIGAFGQGCGTISVSPQSWGGIKGLYRLPAKGESR